jgi:hypothetical protein
MKNLFSLLFALLSWLMVNPLMAQGTSSTLVENTYENIAYVSGGIGDEERDEIRSRERNFNLKLLFAERDGSYLGDVNVVLLNAKGDTVFDVKSVGPFLLLKLPAGKYLIKTSMNGQMQQKRMSITAKGRHEAIFRW